MKTESIYVSPFFRVDLQGLQDALKSVWLAFYDGVNKRALSQKDHDSTHYGEERQAIHMGGLCSLGIHADSLVGEGLNPHFLAFSKIGSSRVPRVHIQKPLKEVAEQDELIIRPPDGRWPSLDQPWELQIVICQANDMPNKPLGMPHWSGAILAERRVTFNQTRKGYDFPHTFFTDEDFQREGYPGDTLVALIGFENVASNDSFTDRSAYVALHIKLKKALMDPKGAKIVGAFVRTLTLAQMIHQSVQCIRTDGTQHVEQDGNGGTTVAQRVLQAVDRGLKGHLKRTIGEESMDFGLALALAQSFCQLTNQVVEVF